MMQFKPKLTLRKQFIIPAPYRAWCHFCEKGFKTLHELTQHNDKKRKTHQGDVRLD